MFRLAVRRRPTSHRGSEPPNIAVSFRWTVLSCDADELAFDSGVSRLCAAHGSAAISDRMESVRFGSRARSWNVTVPMEDSRSRRQSLNSHCGRESRVPISLRRSSRGRLLCAPPRVAAGVTVAHVGLQIWSTGCFPMSPCASEVTRTGRQIALFWIPGLNLALASFSQASSGQDERNMRRSRQSQNWRTRERRTKSAF